MFDDRIQCLGMGTRSPIPPHATTGDSIELAWNSGERLTWNSGALASFLSPCRIPNLAGRSDAHDDMAIAAADARMGGKAMDIGEPSRTNETRKIVVLCE